MDLRRGRINALNKEKLDKPSKYWNVFYQRNGDRFFRDRHWLTFEFEEVLKLKCDSKCNFLEAGCGVGNTLLPLMELYPHWNFFGCDFSSNAISILNEKKSSIVTNKVETFVCDITKNNIFELVGNCGLDIVVLIFVLSAITPEKMKCCIENIALNKGGTILLRDYAFGDEAQIRFDEDNKVQNNQFVRGDGTQAYFFTIEEIRSIFESCGLTTLHCKYVEKQFTKFKDNIEMNRLFIQGVFVLEKTVM